MRIYGFENVKVGHFVTYIVQSVNGGRSRRFIKIVEINKNNSLICVGITGDGRPSFLLSDLFECKSDAVYETIEELYAIYPEEFL